MSDVEQVPHIQVTKCLVHPVAFAEPSDSPSSKHSPAAHRRRLPPVHAGTGAVAVNGSLADDEHDVAVAPGKVAAINRVSGRAGAEARFSSTQMAADYVAVYERILEANG